MFYCCKAVVVGVTVVAAMLGTTTTTNRSWKDRRSIINIISLNNGNKGIKKKRTTKQRNNRTRQDTRWLSLSGWRHDYVCGLNEHTIFLASLHLFTFFFCSLPLTSVLDFVHENMIKKKYKKEIKFFWA